MIRERPAVGKVCFQLSPGRTYGIQLGFFGGTCSVTDIDTRLHRCLQWMNFEFLDAILNQTLKPSRTSIFENAQILHKLAY